jgi:hypothetical protein
MLSNPAVVVDAIRAAANTVRERQGTEGYGANRKDASADPDKIGGGPGQRSRLRRTQ